MSDLEVFSVMSHISAWNNSRTSDIFQSKLNNVDFGWTKCPNIGVWFFKKKYFEASIISSNYCQYIQTLDAEPKYFKASFSHFLQNIASIVSNEYLDVSLLNNYLQIQLVGC